MGEKRKTKKRKNKKGERKKRKKNCEAESSRPPAFCLRSAFGMFTSSEFLARSAAGPLRALPAWPLPSSHPSSAPPAIPGASTADRGPQTSSNGKTELLFPSQFYQHCTGGRRASIENNLAELLATTHECGPAALAGRRRGLPALAGRRNPVYSAAAAAPTRASPGSTAQGF